MTDPFLVSVNRATTTATEILRSGNASWGSEFVLKPCPFCGGPASFIEYGYNEYRYKPGVFYDVGCGNDFCYLCEGADWYFDTKEEAAQKWNVRSEGL